MRNQNDILGRLIRKIDNVIEIYIPCILFVVLFVCFIVGIFFRYVLRDPRTWTFELASICFLNFSILSICYVQRKKGEVVFDLIFNAAKPKTQKIMSVISEVIIFISAIVLIKPSIEYCLSMAGLTTQATHIPKGLVFICFPIMLVTTSARCFVNLLNMQHLRSLQKKSKRSDHES